MGDVEEVCEIGRRDKRVFLSLFLGRENVENVEHLGYDSTVLADGVSKRGIRTELQGEAGQSKAKQSKAKQSSGGKQTVGGDLRMTLW